MSFEERIGYTFSDRELLDRALTHSSYAHEHRLPSNERLEFLGDAVLKLCVAELLFERLGSMREGRLTQLLHKLVARETLVDVAREIDVSADLKLGVGLRREREREGGDKPSILEDAVEGVLGAVYRDGGLPPCQEMVRRWMNKRLDPLLREGARASRDEWKHPKNRLQELTQRRWKLRPEYDKRRVDHPDGTFEWEVAVRLDGRVLATSSDPNSSNAEEAAAAAALTALEEPGGAPSP